MADQQKTDQELIQELNLLRQQVADLKQSELARERVEGALRESEEKYRAVFENTGTATVVLEESGLISLANSEFVRLSGYSPGDIEGKKSWTEFVVKEDLERMQVQHRLRRQDAEKALNHYEFRFVRRNGEIRDIYLSIDMILGTLKSVASLLDITERKRAEEALYTEKQRFQTLSEQAPFGMVMIDQDGTFRYINPKFRELFGYELNDVPDGRTWFRKAYPDPAYRHHVIETWIQDLKTFKPGEKRSEVFTVTCKDGTEKMINFIPVQLATGENLMACENITEQKRAEKALRESEVQLRVILEATADGILAVDDTGKVIKTNQRFADLWRIPPSMIATGDDTTLLHYVLNQLVDPETFVKKVAPLYGTAKLDIDTLCFKDGRVFERYSAPLIREGSGVGRVWSFRDITERKRAEASLRESEERYRSLVANATDMIFIAQSGVLKFPNPATLAVTGYSEEELETLPFTQIIHPEDREMVAERHARRLKGEEVPNTYSFKILTKGEEVLWTQLNGVLITWEGKPGILCSLRDITPQKKLEAQYLHAQKMEAIGTLAGGVAHDFNNLLQTVLGNAEMLLMEEKIREGGLESLMGIKRAAQRGAELTQQLLTFSRKVQSKPRPLDLNQEIVQVEKLLRRTIPRMIEVELRLAGDLRTISADPVQIGQVIMNLAVNARDAMPEGGRLVIGTENTMLDKKFCKSHMGSKSGSYVLLTVSDTGQGMEKQVLDHLFEPFFTTKGMGQGTGLGLAMVYGIVKSHEGYIECESELGKGALFKIYLPAVDLAVEADEAEEKKKPRGGTETILLVDDEASLRDLGKKILSAFGYTVLTASDGEEALEIYLSEKERLHLVVLDLVMPGMGGQKCLEGLRTIRPDVRVLITTGYSPESPARAILEGKADGYLNKPYDMSVLLRMVRKVLDQ